MKWLSNSFRKTATVLTLTTSILLQVPSALANNSDHDWYLHMDIQGMKNSAIVQRENADSKDVIAVAKLLFGEKTYELLQSATAFGNIENDSKRKVLLINGDFSNREQLLAHWKTLGLNNGDTINQHQVYQIKVGDLFKNLHAAAKESGLIKSKEEKDIDVVIDKPEAKAPIYVALQSTDTVIVSDEMSQVEKWLNKNPSESKVNTDGMFEVVVDVQKAMMHAGVNLDDETNNINFESISAKQLSQVSVSYKENKAESTLQLGLKAESIEVASQIKMIVQGLIALKSLSNKNPEVAYLLSSIRMDQNGGDLLVTVSGSINAFKQLIEHTK